MANEEKNNGDIKDLVREKTISYILAGFGLVAGLAWNEAIKSFIEYVFPVEKNTLTAKFVYAAALTVVLVLVSVYLTHLSRVLKENKREEENKEEEDRESE